MILRKFVSLIGLLSACSALNPNPDVCGDGTTNFKTFRYRIHPFNSTTVIGLARFPAEPCKWVIETIGSNLSIAIDDVNTKLLGPKCSSVSPYYKNSSTLLIRTYMDQTTNYDVRICPDQHDTRSYVSTNRIEVFHCNPTVGDKFKLRVNAWIEGTRRATPENRVIAVKRNSQQQSLKLETAKDGIVIQLIDIKVKFGKNRKCKTGYIKVEDSITGVSILPDGLNILCNKSDGTLKSAYWVLSKLQSIKITFKNAKFSMLYYSSPFQEIDKYLRTTDVPVSTTKMTTVLPLVLPKSTTSGNRSGTIVKPRNSEDETNDGIDENNNNSGMFEAIGLGCAAAVVLVAVAVGFIALRKRRIHQRRMSTKPSDDSPPIYMDRHDLGSSDGVRSIDNVMYEKVLKSNASTGTSVNSASFQPPTSHDRLLGKEVNSKPNYASETEKRRQRLSQLEEVYLGIENKPQNKPNGGVRGPLPTPPNEVPITPLFHNDRPPLPPPEPGSPHYYAAIHDNEEEIPSVSYACVTKQKIEKEKEIPEADYSSGKRDITHPPVALYVSGNELQQQGAPSISLFPSEEYLDTEKHSQNSTLAFPPLDKDGYLSLTSEENLNPPVSEDRSYVQANSVSQEDVRKHFIKKQKVPRPGIDKSVATSMPELVHQQRRVNRPRFPAKKQQSDRLRPPQAGSAMRRYRQPRPSAPDIFIQTAYTSGEDLSRIREHLERVAAQGQADAANNFTVQPPSENSSRTGEDSTGSGASYYDSPRPSIDSSQDSLLDARCQANFYDAPRPSLPCIFPDDLRRIVESSENLRM